MIQIAVGKLHWESSREERLIIAIGDHLSSLKDQSIALYGLYIISLMVCQMKVVEESSNVIERVGHV